MLFRLDHHLHVHGLLVRTRVRCATLARSRSGIGGGRRYLHEPQIKLGAATTVPIEAGNTHTRTQATRIYLFMQIWKLSQTKAKAKAKTTDSGAAGGAAQAHGAPLGAHEWARSRTRSTNYRRQPLSLDSKAALQSSRKCVTHFT